MAISELLVLLVVGVFGLGLAAAVLYYSWAPLVKESKAGHGITKWAVLPLLIGPFTYAVWMNAERRRSPGFLR